MTPKTPAYTLRGLNTDIYCSSTGHHSTDIYCSHRGKRCKGWDYDIDCDSVWGTQQPDIGVPKYFMTAIKRELLRILKSGDFRVYELNQDKEKRFEGLRYHDDEWVTRTIERLEREVGDGPTQQVSRESM